MSAVYSTRTGGREEIPFVQERRRFYRRGLQGVLWASEDAEVVVDPIRLHDAFKAHRKARTQRARKAARAQDKRLHEWDVLRFTLATGEVGVLAIGPSKFTLESAWSRIGRQVRAAFNKQNGGS